MTFQQKRHFDKNDISSNVTTLYANKNKISTKTTFQQWLQFVQHDMQFVQCDNFIHKYINKFGAVLFFPPDRQTDKQTKKVE